MLSAKQQQDVCMIWCGAAQQCRYAKPDKVSYNKWYCMKHRKKEKAVIDKQVSDFLADCRKQGIDPYSNSMGSVALGDNCAGYPLLKHIEQGYDKDRP